MVNFLKDCNEMLEGVENQKIVFILSDGRFNKKNVVKELLEAEKRKNLIVFIILDN